MHCSRALLLAALLVAIVLPSMAQQSTPRRAPLFVENRGQWDARARYLARLPGVDAWVTDAGITYDVYRADSSSRGSGHVVAMRFVGTEGRARAHSEHRLAGHHNYFIGNDPKRWASRVPLYDEVAIERLHEGIDARILFDDVALRYDLVVAPHADPSRIAVAFDGASSVRVDARGDLVIATSVGELTHRGLVAYQTFNGIKRTVQCRFVVEGTTRVRFELGSYDRSRPLVIDPIVWSTFYGAAGESLGASLAVDSVGNVYFSGTAYSTGYPTTTGAYDVSFNGGIDGVVTRLNAGGATTAYSTYIGGVDNDWPGRITIDRQGYAYVTFVTASQDYPTTAGVFDETANGAAFDIALTKLAPDGASLVFSTYFGGGGVEDNVDIAIDSARTIYLTGSTTSTNFPTSPTALYPTYLGGITDSWVARFAPDAASLIFSTYLGGDGTDVGSSIAVDSIGRIYVAGYTESTNFPTTAGVLQSTRVGQQDAYIAKLNPAGSVLMYSTLLGGSAHEGVAYIEVDPDGYLYIAGLTSSSNFPLTEGSFQSVVGSQYVAFINQAASQMIYSTYLGGLNDRVSDAALAKQGFFCLTGQLSSRNYPTTSDAVSRTFRGGSFDAFVTIVRPSGGTLSYSTYLGGGGNDMGRGIGLDRLGDVYVSGQTTSADFPVTRSTHAGLNDFYITKLGRCFVVANAGADRTICAGDSLLVGLPAARGIPPYTYRWTSSDGASIPDTAQFWAKPTATTMYFVLATDAVGCEDLDTVVITVNTPPTARAGADTALCAGSSVRIGGAPLGGRAPFAYAWSPAKGLDSRTASTPTARPDSTTAYVVTVTDANGCIGTDTVVVTINRAPVLDPVTDYEICAGDSATLGVTITSGVGPYRYRWAPATGLSSATDAAPRAAPATTTSYRVTVTDANGCSTTSDAMSVTVGSTLRTRITASRSPRLCPGDSVTLDAGEFASYLWSNGATSRTITVGSPGVFSVAITSATGCEGSSDTVRVVDAERAEAGFDGPLSACPGSTLVYTARAGSGASFAWRVGGTSGAIESGTASGELRVRWERPGLDTVTLVVTSRDGCVDSSMSIVTVVDAVKPRIHSRSSIALCPGDTAVLDPGPTFTSYAWSNGSTERTLVVDAAGDYWVDVVDARGCTSRSDTVSVQIRTAPVPEITALGTAICPGDSAVLIAASGYASYRWSNGAQTQRLVVTAAGRYSVTVTDSAGCDGTSSEVDITVHPAPTAPTITVAGDTLTSSPAAAYQWLRDGEQIVGATEQRFVRQLPGTYAVEILDANGCRARSGAAVVENRFVWVDTVSATVGERFRLGVFVDPPLSADDGLTRYALRLRIEPRDLYAHGVLAPLTSSSTEAPSMTASADGTIDVAYQSTQPAIGGTLFDLDLVGLATAQPVSPVRIESVDFASAGDVQIAGHGLVLLDGCDVGSFASGKGVRIRSVRVDRSDRTVVVTYRAPRGALPLLAIVDATGAVVAAQSLSSGVDGDQEARFTLPGSGFFMIELRDRVERSVVPVIITN
jgi:hypothetical protein